MKNSIYNIFIPAGEDEFVCFNSLSGSSALVDGEVRKMIEDPGEATAGPGDEIRGRMMKLGILVGDTVDERKIFDYKFSLDRYSAKISSFIIYPTYGCNLACPYCYETGLKLPKKRMDEATVEKTIEFIRHTTVSNNSRMIILGFFGGEPLLETETCRTIAEEIFEWAKERSIEYYGTLTTNGTLIDDKTVLDLFPYISSLQVTLDGAEDFHNSKRFYSGGRGTYQDIMTNVGRLKDWDGHISFRVHIFSDLNDVKVLLEDLKRRGFDKNPKFHIYFALAAPSDACLHFIDDEEMVRGSEKASVLLPGARRLAAACGFSTEITDDTISGEYLHSCCGYIKKGVYMIDPHGDIYMCPVFTGDKQYSIGSVHAGSFDERTPFYYKILTKSPLTVAECRDCEYLPLCGGGCPMERYMRDSVPGSVYCGLNKELIGKKIEEHFSRKISARGDD
ncbi:Radical SAM domain protein [Methanolacinia petrolearia DSM 11571]|uniref:Radical SAM domain protein n=1 Tax=Methanolacinia petrolearia (strain DSM 11571 / OCM 486 / SEBR 4847) TaxID=679926 RepID=E1RF39_METP4|nr:SPASM domain-containing protein [Methanolacinia petrolearia]ADN37283.1 Radical SAM domain protein [Methanolacinia petrolearia DSM 11571]